MTADPFNPYQSPSKLGEARQVSATQTQTTCFIPAIVLTVGLFLGVLATRGWMIAWFQGYGLEFPASTVLALRPGFLVFLGMLMLLTLTKEYSFANLRAKRMTNIVVSLAAVLLAFFYVAAMFLPFITIGTGLS